MSKHLPTEAAARKKIPLYSGLMRYFPDALVAVAALSQIGNDQHNPGQHLHWDRSKSTDEHDTLMRHLLEAGTLDTDGVRHSTKVAWRALAALQKEIEREQSNVCSGTPGEFLQEVARHRADTLFDVPPEPAFAPHPDSPRLLGEQDF